MKLVTLKEYAELHGKSARTIRQRALSGRLKTARKIGSIWIVDQNEPYIDYRRKENKE